MPAVNVYRHEILVKRLFEATRREFEKKLMKHRWLHVLDHEFPQRQLIVRASNNLRDTIEVLLCRLSNLEFGGHFVYCRRPQMAQSTGL